MNDKEKLQKIKELCKEYAPDRKSYILDQINRIVNQSDDIIIPFKFEIKRGDCQKIALPFGNNQVLIPGSEPPWYVGENEKQDNRKMKLGKEVAWSELKKGYWYYVCDGNDIRREVSFQDKSQYRLYIGDGAFVAITDDKSVFVTDANWKHYYEIEVADD